MKTRIVHTKVWKDQWFVNLSKDAKFLWLYLLTNDKVNISGVFELSDREILFDTSIDTSILTSIKHELKPKAFFCKGWVRICNVERYNKYLNSPLNVTSCIRELSYIPDDIKKELNIPSDTSIYTPINKEQEIENKELEIRNQKSKEEKQEKLKIIRDELFKRMSWKA